MNNKLKLTSGKVTLIFLTALALIFTSYFIIKKPEIEIKNFNKSRDTDFILESFKRDYYWLVENPEFSPQFMIDNISPNKDPKYFGALNIKVLFKNDKPIGFTTYFKKKFYEGKIQFVYVHPEYRCKGYATMLTKYAINDLFKQSVSKIILDTRTTNAPALKAYQRIGFKESYRDDERGIVSFELFKSDYK